jgi:DNA-binding transcriptional MerR regulator
MACYRMYTQDSVLHIRFIKRPQDLGFSLKEIKELLSLAEDQTTDCADVRALAQTKVVEISQKVRNHCPIFPGCR